VKGEGGGEKEKKERTGGPVTQPGSRLKNRRFLNREKKEKEPVFLAMIQ